MSEHDERMEGAQEPAELEEQAKAQELTESEDPTPGGPVSEQTAPEEESVASIDEDKSLAGTQPEGQPSKEEPVEGGAPVSEPVQGEIPPIDLNTATEEELQQLPGIGQVLAARIVAYRTETGPFRKPAEIMQVSGVSEATYENIADRLVATGPGAEEAPGVEAEDLKESAVAGLSDEELPEAGPEALESEPMLVPEPEVKEAKGTEKPPRGPEPPLVEVVPSPFPWGRVLFIGFLSTLLGAALVLAILFVINGTLNFRGAAERAVQAEIQRVESELDTARGRLAEVEGRLGAIQELDTRLTDTEMAAERLSGELASTQAQIEDLATSIGSLQQDFTNLREDLDGLAEHVSSLDGDILGLQERVDGLQKDLEAVSQATERFDAFLNGLRDLLSQPEGRMAPTLTVEPTLTSTPVSRQTPTLRPMVTVIPLATPSPTP